MGLDLPKPLCSPEPRDEESRCCFRWNHLARDVWRETKAKLGESAKVATASWRTASEERMPRVSTRSVATVSAEHSGPVRVNQMKVVTQAVVNVTWTFWLAARCYVEPRLGASYHARSLVHWRELRGEVGREGVQVLKVT